MSNNEIDWTIVPSKIGDKKGIPRSREDMAYAVESGYVIPAFRDAELTVELLLDYVDLKLDWYIPSVDSIDFINFIRLCVGREPENRNSKAQYFFIDCLFQSDEVKPYFDVRGMDYESLKGNTLILSSREFSKSTLVAYFMLYMAAGGKLPNFDQKVKFGIYVSDRMDGNVKTTMQTMESLHNESDYLRGLFEYTHFTDAAVEFIRNPVSKSEVKAYNLAMSKGLGKDEVAGRSERRFKIQGIGSSGGRGPTSLDSVLFTDKGKVTMGDIEVGTKVFTPKGDTATVISKSKIYNNRMFRLTYEDGRTLKVNETHINVAWTRRKIGEPVQNENIVTLDLVHKFNSGKWDIYTKNTEPVQYTHKDFVMNPYLLGIHLGDGSSKLRKSLRIRGLKDDCEFYYEKLKDKYDIDRNYKVEKNGTETLSLTVRGTNNLLQELGLLGVTGANKFIPEEYLYGSISQRKELLAGLLDADGSCCIDKRTDTSTTTFSNVSQNIAKGVTELCRSLGYSARMYQRDRGSNRQRLYIVRITPFENPFTLPRKVSKYTEPKRSLYDYSKLVSIEEIVSEPSQCITLDSHEHEYLTDYYLPTHNSRNVLDRPQFAIFDDMVANEKDAFSSATLAAIDSTIDADIGSSLSGNGHFKVLIGTAYHTNDPVYKRVTDGTWLPVVFPKAEQPPTKDLPEEDFVSVWEDRHSYEKQRSAYAKAETAKSKGNNKPLKTIDQEMYVRVTSEHERLVPTDNLRYECVKHVWNNAKHYNWYVTTDYTTSDSSSSNRSCQQLWAIGADETHYLMDLYLRRQTIADGYRHTAELIMKAISKGASWVDTGVEIDGQQVLHLIGLEKYMEDQGHSNHLGFATQKSPSDKKVTWSGIRSRGNGDKLWRLKLFAPTFHDNKVVFNKTLSTTKSQDLEVLERELKMVTDSEIKSTDDGIDGVSQLALIDIEVPIVRTDGDSVGMLEDYVEYRHSSYF